MKKVETQRPISMSRTLRSPCVPWMPAPSIVSLLVIGSKESLAAAALRALRSRLRRVHEAQGWSERICLTGLSLL